MQVDSALAGPNLGSYHSLFEEITSLHKTLDSYGKYRFIYINILLLKSAKLHLKESKFEYFLVLPSDLLVYLKPYQLWTVSTSLQVTLDMKNGT